MLRLSFLLATAISLTGCFGKDKSHDIESKDIYFEFNVYAKESGHIKIRLDMRHHDAFGDSVVLSHGERISVTFLGETILLSKDQDTFDVDYEGAFESHGDHGTMYVHFQRKDFPDIEFDIEVPPSFQVSHPVDGDEFDEGDTLIADWTNSIANDFMRVDGWMYCRTTDAYDDDSIDSGDTENETWAAPDIGEYEVPLQHLIDELRQEVSWEGDYIIDDACDFELTFTRENTKSLNRYFDDGSSAVVEQYRKVRNMVIELD